MLIEGETLLARGEYEQALEIFQSAIDRSGESAAGHFGQARAYLALNRRQDAADSLEVVLAIDPTALSALILLATIRREAGAIDEALCLLRRARCVVSEDAMVLAELAASFRRCGEIPEAIALYSEAIRVAPSDSRPHVNLGMIYLQQIGDARLAESHFRAALASNPDQLEACANLGLALHDQGRYAEEFEQYRRALLVHPESTVLRWNQAIANLSAGDFSNGWCGYQLRFTRPEGRDFSRFPFGSWDGAPMPNARLLVLAEQGVGDEVMFASCVPSLPLMTKGIVLECAPRLASLFARSFPQVDVQGRDRNAPLDWLQRYTDIGAQVPIGSLPMTLRQSHADFPNHSGYLRADPRRVEAYRTRLTACRQTLNVGLSWRAGTQATRGSLRSIALTELKPLLSIERIQFVSLQHQLDEVERELLRDGNVLQFAETLTDIDELAALISALDLVITVANSNLHFAGALGCPAWGLLGTSPDWRWLREGSVSPWYPSVMLFRAGNFGGWEPMLAEVTARLRSRVGGG